MRSDHTSSELAHGIKGSLLQYFSFKEKHFSTFIKAGQLYMLDRMHVNGTTEAFKGHFCCNAVLSREALLLSHAGLHGIQLRLELLDESREDGGLNPLINRLRVGIRTRALITPCKACLQINEANGRRFTFRFHELS